MGQPCISLLILIATTACASRSTIISYLIRANYPIFLFPPVDLIYFAKQNYILDLFFKQRRPLPRENLLDSDARPPPSTSFDEIQKNQGSFCLQLVIVFLPIVDTNVEKKEALRP